MLLFTHRDDRILATVNIVTNECTTSAILSACVIFKQDTRKTKLKTLIMDLAPNHTRKYGCEISSVKSGDRARTDTWQYEVLGLRKFLPVSVVSGSETTQKCLFICVLTISGQYSPLNIE